MKILQVTNSFKYAWESGGVTRVAYDLSRQLVARGHKVTVFATEKGLPKDIDIKRNIPVEIGGIETYYFSNVSDYLAQRALSIPYRAPLVIRKRLQEFDIIHLHEPRRVIMPIIHHYAKKYDIPYVLQAHGSLPVAKPLPWLKRIYDDLWGYRLLRDAYKVIALTKTEAEQYKSMGVSKDKIEIIPNGINLSEFENLPSRGEFRKKHGLGDNQKIVLYLGRIHQTKGLNLLVKAFARLSNDFGKARLVIAGPDHGYLPALQELIKELKIEERVLFTGLLYEKDKLEAYVDADVFVTPSFSGFPITFMEACASGTPIITTERGDALDWLHGQVGYVTPYEEDELEKAMTKILSDPATAKKFGENGQKLTKEELNWREIAIQVEHLYIGCLGNSANNAILRGINK